MSNKTIKVAGSTFRGSIGAGMGSLFNPNGKKYYILEHKVGSKYHRQGETQEIIVDTIELGRDSHCQVRFDEKFNTVSRRHAAIVKDGEGWKLVQLSSTNSTFLNGKPVKQEWYLQNGDEIQLSVNGPKLGFIIPTGSKATVGSIGLTRRMSLFRQQALRPYKNAIAGLFTILIMLSCFGGYTIYDQHRINKDLQAKQDSIQADNDTLRNQIAATTSELLKDRDLIMNLSKRVGGHSYKTKIIKPNTIIPDTIRDNKREDIHKLYKDVYFIYLAGYKITNSDGETGIVEVGDTFLDNKVSSISGTGFLLNDGTFVTARHVIEPWYYGNDELSVKLNMLITNLDFKVDAILYAVSSSGSNFELQTSKFRCNRSHDKIQDIEGYKIREVSLDYLDYAAVSVGKKGSLSYDSQLCANLKAGEKLTIIGYPLGLGASSNKVEPSLSSADVARDGLADGGYILTTSTGFEQGNSGGPVFAERNNKKIVIGIVSAGAGRSTGFVVPISAIK